MMLISVSRSNLSLFSAVAFGLALLSYDVTHAQQPAPAAPAEAKPSPLGEVGRWFEEAWSKMGSTFKNAQGGVENFGKEAGIAAKTGIDAAKDAADSVGRLGNARVISGHQNCTVAANGAPDCIAAAVTLCKAKGFTSGKSVDMTTAEECPAQVMLGRRQAEPGECKTVTFVTRAYCQ